MRYLATRVLAFLLVISACDSTGPRESAPSAKAYAASRASMTFDSTAARGRVLKLERGQTEPTETSDEPPPLPANCKVDDTEPSLSTSTSDRPEPSLTTKDGCGNVSTVPLSANRKSGRRE
jgi:hypothetical protein